MQNNISFPTLPYLNQERTQKFMSIALTLLALSFFGFFAINPTISTILKLRKELSDNQFVYNQLNVKIKNLSELRIRYADLQNDLSTITDAIATQPDVHLLFAQIQSAAQQSSIKILKLQNFEVEVLKNSTGPKKPYYSYSFSMAGSGSLESVSNFVSTITNMQRVINIDILAINNTTYQNVPSVGFNMQGTAYFKQ